MKWTTSASANPAVNPELLDELGQKFTEYNYDFKKLVRDICTSRTYQLSTATNETNASRQPQLFPRGPPADAGGNDAGFDHAGHRHQK